MFPIRDHNPAERPAIVTYILIAVNVLIYVYGLAALTDDRALSQFYFDYALIPARLNEGEAYSGLITSMFLHGGFMHLAGNILFLWIFGDNMEDKMGSAGFLIFYLMSGVTATYVHYLTAPTSPVPLVGASGAIAGVMGGYLLLFPKAQVDIFVLFVFIIRIFPLPAWIMLTLWFGLQVFNGVGTSAEGGGVAYWAHASGFVIGLLLTIPVWLRSGAADFWRRTDGHPDHPEANYDFIKSRMPKVRRGSGSGR
ncbi:rhomboid family intramembrane serine protease [Cognatiyoonia sp.]|uniref:rhomboid family intramembrane serine protease n=1 Tax=Cognatiyoonia sp. TaxID=2211652 RepID=UPI003F696BF0